MIDWWMMTDSRQSEQQFSYTFKAGSSLFRSAQQQNIVSLKDRRVHVYLDSQSMPTHHPLRNNTDVLRLLLHWLTSFKLKLLVSLHHLRGHHALNLQGEREISRSLCIFIDRDSNEQLCSGVLNIKISTEVRTCHLLTNKVFYAEIENPIGRMYSGCIHSATHG